MTRTAWLLRGAFAWLTLGCGVAPSEGELGVEQRPVISGEVDRIEAHAAVIVVKNRVDEVATGVLVAPTLVLTSRQLQFDIGSDTKERFFLQCAEASNGKLEGQPILRAQNPGDYFVGTGSQLLRVARFFAGPELDRCASDLLLLQLESPVRDIAPLPLRLDTPPVVGERGWLVGWGMTDQSDDVGKSQGVVLSEDRMRRAVDVRAVGRSVFSPPGGSPLTVPSGMFITPPSGCYGDNGAPFIGESGAVIGILSNIAPTTDPYPYETTRDCRFGVAYFRSLHTQSAWLRAAFREAGEVPWLEHLTQPAALGESCSEDRECLSGLCVFAAEGHAFCSSACDASSCPDDFECLGDEGERLCLPSRLGVAVATSRGCEAAGSAPRGSSAHASLLGLASSLLGWRRWKRRSTADSPKEKL